MSTLEYLSEHQAPVYAGITGILLLSVLGYILLHSARPQPAPPPPQITAVIIQPPKPPPPPPPLPQPKTIVQPKMTTPVQKPVVPNQPPKAAPPKAAPALGTSLKANGSSNAFDLSGNGNGNGIIGGSGTGDGGGGDYAAAVQGQIQTALQNNPVTRKATAGLVVLIWTDPSGLVTRVEVTKSSGDPAVDDAVQHQVLPHMQLYPPPPDTPMPIKMSLTGEQTLQ